MQSLDRAIANTRAHLLSLRNEAGHWEGHLSSSALSTATAVVALHGVDPDRHHDWIAHGATWLTANQNADGGWGDTTVSKSNLSTTLLCWGALRLAGPRGAVPHIPSLERCEAWILRHVGSLEPAAITKAVIARYGKDKTFSVPILMHCTICGVLGELGAAWRRVLPLPFELAALPRTWFGAIGLPVVSYALPALIAIGYTRFNNAPPAWWNPLRWLRASLWPRISPMLKALQPASGGYLEATPLTSFVTMALAAAGQKDHPCVPLAVRFLRRSMRGDGSWPIDTNLATWGTTLAVKALGDLGDTVGREEALLNWLLQQQYKVVHPFTNAAPGGWAWTDLPGGVPDADDTPGALIALAQLKPADDEFRSVAVAGITWLLDLQNRDGGIPTFCRGWGTLPFDRSTPELTAHALLAWWLWEPQLKPDLRSRVRNATRRALDYLHRTQREDGSWVPLWFGNEHASDEENPVYGTAQVVSYLHGCPALADQARDIVEPGISCLLRSQQSDGGWGGDASAPPSIEETAVAVHALCGGRVTDEARRSIQRGADWLLRATNEGLRFPTAPIGLYFARLWYHEQLYPVVWSLQALRSAKRVLSFV